MTIVKSANIRENFKSYCDIAATGEPVFISRAKGKDVVMISRKEYERYQKIKANADYLAMLDHSIQQMKDGKIKTFSYEEFEAISKK